MKLLLLFYLLVVQIAGPIKKRVRIYVTTGYFLFRLYEGSREMHNVDNVGSAQCHRAEYERGDARVVGRVGAEITF